MAPIASKIEHGVQSAMDADETLPTRLMAGLAILKHTFNLSDEELCARWVENPYFQFFCGETFFRYDLPFDRSSMKAVSGMMMSMPG